MDRWIVAFLAGHIIALFSPLLLPMDLLLAVVFLTLFFTSLISLLLTKYKHYNGRLNLVNGFVIGAVYVMCMANLHFAQNFVVNKNQTFLIKGSVTSVVVQKPSNTSVPASVTFSIKVDDVDGMPIKSPWYLSAPTVRVNWFKPNITLQQGDELLASIKLSKPHGYQNSFGFDYNQWLFAKQFIGTGSIKKIHTHLRYSEKSTFSNSTQQQSTNKLIKATDGLTTQSIILAVGLGNRSLMELQEFELYNHMGISHLLAISGLHIGIIFLVIKLLLKWISKLLRVHINYTLLQALVLCLLWLYIALIDFPVSANRAGLFVSLWVLLNVSFSNINKVKLLLVVALFSLLIDPFSVLTAAWWLTFSAVLGIILFIQKYPLIQNSSSLNKMEELSSSDITLINQAISKTKNAVKSAITKIAYLVKFQVFISIWMMPVVLFWFGGVSLSGVLTNLIAIPLFSIVLVPCIFIGTFLIMFGVDDAGYLFVLADKVLSLLIDVFSLYPVFHFWLDVANGVWFYILLLILLILVLPAYFYNNQRGSLFKYKPLIIILIVFLFAPIVLSVFPWQTFSWQEVNGQAVNQNDEQTQLELTLKPKLIMYVLDVGQGTSILFQQGTSGFIYDLGPVYPSGFNATQAVVKPMVVGLGITDIDHIVISHNDSDHIGNINVLGDAQWIAARKRICQGQTFNWLSNKVEVIWPQNLIQAGENILSKNDRSCVIKLTDSFTGKTVLLTGDITSKIEQRLLAMHNNRDVNLNSDILISAHHGSKYSSAMSFINAVSPSMVLHSAGVNNRFGFPTKNVVKRFEFFNVDQYSTNEIGMIKVVLEQGLEASSEQDIRRINVTGYLSHWQPFWKKQNPFIFTSEIR
jgi:competence protein ComEC